MFKRQRGDVDDPTPDLAAVWATDDIPVDDGPPEFLWATRPTEPEPDGTAVPPSRFGKVAGAGLAAALLLALGAAVLWPRSDDPPDDVADETDAPPSTLSLLPDATVTTVPTPQSTQPLPDVAETDPGSAEPSTGVLDEVTGEADPARPTSIELPPALASMSLPTEVVMTTADGFVTLSLPSGTLRYADLPSLQTFQGLPMVVTPDATAFTGDRSLTIMSRDGTYIEVAEPDEPLDLFLRGWTRAADGTALFQVSAYGPDIQTEFLVSADGEMREQTVPSSLTDTFLRSSDGNIVNDTGGVYLTSADGTSTRISTGHAFAANNGNVLLRECDEQRLCTIALVDADTGERTPLDWSDDELGNAYALDLAPDGAALSRQVEGTSGGGAVQLVALDGTLLAEVDTYGFYTVGSSWVADSSGIVEPALSGGGLRFLDRGTGEALIFGVDELGQVTGYGLRYPDAELPPPTADPITSPVQLSDVFTVPTGLDLVVVGAANRMAYVDIDAATASTWSVPDLRGTQPPGIFATGPGELAVISAPGFDRFGAGYGVAELIESSELPAGPRFPGPLGLVWVRQSEYGVGINHQLIDVTESLPSFEGPRATVENSTLLGGDSTGGLLAEVGGDIFSVGADGQHRITSGDLLALSATHALVRECDDDLTCTTELVARQSGARSAVSEPRALAAAPVDADRDGPIADTISPDGTAMLVRLPDESDPKRWVMVDLVDQTSFTIPDPADGQPLVWNALSTAMAYVSDGRLHVYDRVNGRVATVMGLGEVAAVASVDPDFADVDPNSG